MASAEVRAIKASADFVGHSIGAEVLAQPHKYGDRLMADSLLVSHGGGEGQ